MRLKFTIILAAAILIAAVGITCHAQQNPGKLTPAHVKAWTEIQSAVKEAEGDINRAELNYYRAKEARDKTLQKAQADFDKMQQEAKCDKCSIDSKELKWIRPK